MCNKPLHEEEQFSKKKKIKENVGKQFANEKCQNE